MYVQKINEVKDLLTQLKEKGLVGGWELPYENLLTRLNAAIFFLNPCEDNQECITAIWNELGRYEDFSYRINEERTLSDLLYRVTFSSEEKRKNLQISDSDNKISV